MKVLPMKEPLISTLPDHAGVISIINQVDDYYPWFLTRFIQMQAPKHIRNNFLVNFYYPFPMYFNCPFINWQKLSKQLLEGYIDDITNFFIQCIDNNFYIRVGIDSQYVSAYKHHYKKKYRPHTLGIHGYDKTKGIFYITDFFNLHFAIETASFAEIRDGYHAVNMSGNNFDYITLFSMKDKYSFRFSPHIIIKYLEDYLRPDPLQLPHTDFDNWRYGIDVYTSVKEYLLMLESDPIRYDRRIMHILYEHKRCMNFRIDYLNTQQLLDSKAYNHISPALKKVESKVLLARNLSLKFGITGNKLLIESIVNILDEVVKIEIEYLNLLVENLSCNSSHPKLSR